MSGNKRQYIANTLVEYLVSRAGAISGYWGIGVLCLYCVRKGRQSCGVSLTDVDVALMLDKVSGENIRISGHELTKSRERIEHIVGSATFSRIDINITFRPRPGVFSEYSDWYECEVLAMVAGNGRTRFAKRIVNCWPHNASRECRRVEFE